MTMVSTAKNLFSLLVLTIIAVNIEGTSPPQAPQSFNAIRQLTNVPIPVGFNELVAQAKKSGRNIEVLRNEVGLLNYLIGMSQYFCVIN